MILHIKRSKLVDIEFAIRVHSRVFNQFSGIVIFILSICILLIVWWNESSKIQATEVKM
jgi:hypothetical protein